jgi:hypothetical protein
MTVSIPVEAITRGPNVEWRHIDGPLMTWAGNLHWLTWRERLALWLRLTTVDAVAVKLWPYLAQCRANIERF